MEVASRPTSTGASCLQPPGFTRLDQPPGSGDGADVALGYDPGVDRNTIRAFVERDWSRIEEAKAAFWKGKKPGMSAAELLAIGDELRRYAQRVRPDWPTVQDRAEDLAVHLRVSDALRAVRAKSR